MKKVTLGLGALALAIGATSIFAGSVLAYQGDSAVKGPNYSEDRHTAMEQAFENNDYNAWKSLMVGKGRVTQVVNKDNFLKFAEAHKLSEEGKTVEAQQIRKDLGLGLRNGSGAGSRTGDCTGSGVNRQGRGTNR